MGDCAVDGRACADVEVTAPPSVCVCVIIWPGLAVAGAGAGAGAGGGRDIPVVRDINNRLLTLITNKLNLILRRQNGLRLALLTSRIPNAHLNGTRIPLLAINTAVLEQEGIAAMTLDSMRAVKDTLPPARGPAVQGIGPIVLIELVLAAI